MSWFRPYLDALERKRRVIDSFLALGVERQEQLARLAEELAAKERVERYTAGGPQSRGWVR